MPWATGTLRPAESPKPVYLSCSLVSLTFTVPFTEHSLPTGLLVNQLKYGLHPETFPYHPSQVTTPPVPTVGCKLHDCREQSSTSFLSSGHYCTAERCLFNICWATFKQILLICTLLSQMNLSDSFKVSQWLVKELHCFLMPRLPMVFSSAVQFAFFSLCFLLCVQLFTIFFFKEYSY